MAYKYIKIRHTFFLQTHTFISNYLEWIWVSKDLTWKPKWINTVFELNKDQRKLYVRSCCCYGKNGLPFLYGIFAQLTHNHYRTKMCLFYQRAYRSLALWIKLTSKIGITFEISQFSCFKLFRCQQLFTLFLNLKYILRNRLHNVGVAHSSCFWWWCSCCFLLLFLLVVLN